MFSGFAGDATLGHTPRACAQMYIESACLLSCLPMAVSKWKQLSQEWSDTDPFIFFPTYTIGTVPITHSL